MKKIYVLDTNVLLQDPRALFAFEENDVLVPAIVLQELDTKKKYMNEIGRNAREVARILDQLRGLKPLHQGVPLENGGQLRVELNHLSYEKMKETLPEATSDNRLLALTLNLEEERKEAGRDEQVILVSKDALVRIKAEALGLKAEDFLSDRVLVDDDLYKGYTVAYVEPALLECFYQDKNIPVTDLPGSPLYPFSFVILKNELQPSISGLGRVDESGEMLRPITHDRESVWGVKPRNVQQKMAINILLDPRLSLVTLTGKAGTGKTLLSMAAGLLQTEDLKLYKKLLISRPVVPMGKDIGYLPGEKDEKLRPWMQPIFDNLEFLFNANKPGEVENILPGLGSIQVEALTYIRGRSLPGQLIIVDEAQNLTKHEVKTILTRVGDRTKIVLMGDTEQIDHPYLDAYNNGLAYAVERFKDQALSGHVSLQKGERSTLAQLAADLL
ncbi:PhoH family protein [Natribacillus halophilus]|uniref:PhoH-like ATPase n=1 Tax=Natribacillus halophilus TaxID=549003 RepID=A0A1G8MBW2_9BACI|nr:PhoH family protein [Natribacillus halophilus]SDI65436.1 PhoH-like ATPase [Natribacillus halophilus]